MLQPVVRWSLIALCLVVAPLRLGLAQDNAALTGLVTVAEASQYKSTATGAEVDAMLKSIASNWPGASLISLGETVEGRAISALVVEPSAKGTAKPLTVLLLGGIHAGECDGKEALLALARDMASGKLSEIGRGLRLIFVPNFNADGNERRGKLHRPGQAGPVDGAGIRENAQGLDLNRDFIKLETPEVTSLVSALNRYDVDVLIDTHTTNGSLHRYDLTYDIPHNPGAPASLDECLRKSLLPHVAERLSQAGMETFYYGNFDADHRKWETYGHEPRYSTEYMGVRGKIGILVESYSYASYQRRVEVSYAFVRELLDSLGNRAAEIRQMIDQVNQNPQADDHFPIGGKLARTSEAVIVKGYQTSDGSAPRGPYGPDSAKGLKAKDYELELWNRAEASKFIRLPTAYAISPQYAWAVGRLARHGIQLTRLKAESTLEAQSYQIEKTSRGSSLQGHTFAKLETSTVQRQMKFSPGTYIVNTAQPLGRLAAHLLEPETDDSLAAWNFFDPDLTPGSTFPVQRIVNAVPSQLLEAVVEVAPGEQITLEHLNTPGRSVRYGGAMLEPIPWLKDRPQYVINRDATTYAVDAATGAMQPIDELRTLSQKLASLEAFSVEQARAAASARAFSPDWKHALIPHRRDLYYFDAANGAARQLTHSPEAEEQMPELSPNGALVAFVRDHNLWTVDTVSTEVKQLTRDGSAELLNGVLDWVYQEELYGRGNFKAFWWSPDSRQLAFLQLDQTPVPHYQVSDSISFGQKLEDTRYPKAGEPLPTARMWTVDVRSGEIRQVDLSAFAEDDRLIARVTWSPSNELWLQVFNRIQNQQSVVKVDPKTGASTTILKEQSEGWIEVLGTPEFLPNGDFLWLSDLPDGRRHLYRVSSKTGQKTALTTGAWDIESFVALTSDKTTALVQGNLSHATDLQLIAVDVERGSPRQITTRPGSHRCRVDGTGKYFIDSFSSYEEPPTISLHTMDGKMVRVLAATVSDRHKYLDVRPVEPMEIVTRDGVHLQALVMLPRNLDAATARLPVLFHVYGGPQAPTVQNAWSGSSYWWHQMLCQEGFAVVLCDNRSARGRGIKDTWTIRGDMGRVELQDLEDAVKWVQQQPWADPDRIGLWGWSYGGYFTAYALTHSKSFRAGIAGAPVTDWRNYDAIYTERYMDLPKNNEAGYKSSSVVEAAANLNGRLLLIHGERDDNVHISNTLQLADALQNAGKQFDLMVYPKNRHGITDADQRAHMQQLMTDFLRRYLKGER